MNIDQLEQRLAAVEKELAAMRLTAGGPSPYSKWWEKIPPIPEGLRQDWDDMQEICRYIRRTGNEPPPDWKPGDPIPEPDHWQ